MGVTTSHPGTVDVRSDHVSWSIREAATTAGVVTIMCALVVASWVQSVPAPAALPIVALVPAASIDLRERRLPDPWVAFAGALWLVGTWMEWTATGSLDVADPLVAASLFAGPILALHLFSPASMGFGDVKAGLVLGAAVGSIDWRLGLVALTLAAGTAGAIGILARARTLPFGPFLVAGSAAAVLAAGVWLDPIATGGVGA